MKVMKILVAFIVGFVTAIYLLLNWLVTKYEVLKGFKKGIIDDFEYLLLGYNTIKTEPYYKRWGMNESSYRSFRHHMSSYNDYYKNKGFKEDEEEEEC